PGASASLSWAMAEFLIKRARIGCVPGADFGANGEGYVRFCFARDRAELTGALESMRTIFANQSHGGTRTDTDTDTDDFARVGK
ncbi:MAG: hypothetical protein M3P13_08830, partial [Acidobacteriota bacterium]|nr:hypothetical protein [Acidobacteriota bacterium]